jgi:hypothetical protein
MENNTIPAPKDTRVMARNSSSIVNRGILPSYHTAHEKTRREQVAPDYECGLGLFFMHYNWCRKHRSYPGDGPWPSDRNLVSS